MTSSTHTFDTHVIIKSLPYCVGDCDGTTEGRIDGATLGGSVVSTAGTRVGTLLGRTVGEKLVVLNKDGANEGNEVGPTDEEGAAEGAARAACLLRLLPPPIMPMRLKTFLTFFFLSLIMAIMPFLDV
jgi:hypothetical protein